MNVSNRQLGKRSVQRSLSKSGDVGAFAGGFDSMNHLDTWGKRSAGVEVREVRMSWERAVCLKTGHIAKRHAHSGHVDGEEGWWSVEEALQCLRRRS
jgi:hypothetical protein